jgi:uncharacterized protein
MNCPNCESALETIDMKGIKVDECVRCQGHWFDRGELRLAKDKQDDDIRWLDFDPFGKDAEEFSTASEGKRCPKCAEQMKALTYRQSKVVIDKCPECYGVWLDHGELEKIVKYLTDILLTKSAGDYTKATFRQFLEIFTGPEGPISEAKDFLSALWFLQLRIGVENPKITEAARNIYNYTPFK